MRRSGGARYPWDGRQARPGRRAAARPTPEAHLATACWRARRVPPASLAGNRAMRQLLEIVGQQVDELVTRGPKTGDLRVRCQWLAQAVAATMLPCALS